MEELQVPKRIANTIMNALQGGVVPRTGLGYIAVGRDQEISALLKDVEIIEEGGATFRFVSGNYGSGKTFLLQSIKEHVMAKGFIVADADLSPERSLVGVPMNKKGLATFRELMRNISTKTSPTGGALEKVIDRWMDSMYVEVAKDMTGLSSGMDMVQLVSDRIIDTIGEMTEMTNGFDFAAVLTLYWKAKQADDKDIKYKALKWLRGEYRIKRDAQRELGISNIIDDSDWFNYIKIYAEFFKKIGYSGFIIMIDEMINIYKYSRQSTRQKNYEIMLNMYNDALQGKAQYLGIIFGGTPKSVEDPDRGVFSYEALKSRLESGRFQKLNVVNLMTPIIRVQPLTKSEIVVLLEKITKIHTGLYDSNITVSEEELIEFVQAVFNDPKNEYVTPRSIIRDYINLLNILYQNPGRRLGDIMGEYAYSSDQEEDLIDIDDDEF